MSLPTSGLVLNLDAAPANIAFNGPDVGGWNETSGAGNHGLQGTAALQPLYEVSGWGGTYPSLLINGETAGKHLTFDAGTLPTALSGNDTPYTITLVAQITTNPTGERYLLSAGNSGVGAPFLILDLAADDRFGFRQRDDASVATTAREAVTTFDAGRLQITMHFDGTTRTLYKNGVSVATSAAALGTCTFNIFTLGRMRRTGLEEGVDFRTPGMTIYNRALATSELRDLWRYNRGHFGGLTLASDLVRTVTFVELGAGAVGLLREVTASVVFAETADSSLALAKEVPVTAALQETSAGLAGLTVETGAAASMATLGSGAATLLTESVVSTGSGTEALTLPHTSTETLQ